MGMMKVMLMFMMMMMVLVGTMIGEVKAAESYEDCVKRCTHMCVLGDRNCVRQCIFFNCGPPSLPTNLYHSKRMKAQQKHGIRG
ncbi:uncharacterized protein LOC111830744 [Capsella rubella]|uniref:uncharacterized protein LOC111830744 n=1 Tax=Capsella rubella TaxID=81985 RepID=UPI000CD52306|nr:uncharacterized protein LOC111830744 [Capsella rubella]